MIAPFGYLNKVKDFKGGIQMNKKGNRLTHNEMIILKLRAGGHDYDMIANHLRLSKDMVQKLQKNALKKIEASLNGRKKD